MSKDIWLISDTHFGHANICNFLRPSGFPLRPWDNVDEMDVALMDNWNKVVKEGDKVYHLGDLLFDKKREWILKNLNGTKRLVRGNHDKFSTDFYKKYFAEIYGVRFLDGFIFSHIPIHPASMRSRLHHNIHGHLHSNLVKKEDGSEDERYINVSVEQIDYTPISFEEIKAKI